MRAGRRRPGGHRQTITGPVTGATVTERVIAGKGDLAMVPVEPAGDVRGQAADDPASLRARFEDVKLIGRGGMGVVYRARDPRVGRDVAIKLLLTADPHAGGSLLREAQAQARIEHENACKVYEAGAAEQVPFIVMQLINGLPLDKARGSMTLEEKARAIRQIASALHEAHRLGLVHRDVKPGNIMVERGEDGAWKPYIMDFGLARDVGDSGRTVTGAIVGTPAFMAPEQAAGKVRSLDRRTDVYSLGATLYDVLAGRPPFVADSLLQILKMVTDEEVGPIRQVDPSVPRDLEAIVMKCLEKDPDRRYDSAKALGEDLQRFLDGDPVAARRASLGYLLLKRARRNKAAVAVAGAALVAALTVTGLGVRARRIAGEQATLARELGESVKEMELFLRSAHAMPLHDIERERDIVRARLGGVRTRMAAAGDIGEGPGHYALGRGHLALQEAATALGHLEKAAAAGYRSAELAYAMGVALSELYKKALEGTKRIQTEEQRKAAVAKIEADYKEPALRHLRAALGDNQIEAPEYAEGLIALYEGRHEEALAKAREAFAKAPWFYEAKRLEGDVLFAMGSRYRHDAAFDHEKMMTSFRAAAEAYQIAADLGRSDPAVYEAECELWTQVMNAAPERGESMRPGFEKATSVCEKVIAVNPKSGSGYVKLAGIHNGFAWWLGTGQHAGEDPEAAIEEAVKRAEEAARRSPEDPMARYQVGSLWRTRALYANSRGLDNRGAIDRAVTGYEEALQLDPGFLWALNELCSSLGMRAWYEAFHGVDPGASVEQAIERCDRAIGLDAEFMFPKAGKIITTITMAEYLVATGRSPGAVVEWGLQMIKAAEEQSPKWRWIPFWRAHLYRIESTYALESGGDPGAAMERAEASVKELEQVQASSASAHQMRGEVAAIKARWLLARGGDAGDPGASLREAREAFARAVEANPWDVGYRVWSARIEITAIRWAMGRDRADAAQFESALAKVTPLLDVERADPRLYQALAEIHELRAAWLMGRKKDAEEAIEEGLRMAEKALAKNPRMASALAGKGRLLLLRARRTSEPRARGAVAREALDALSAAIRENPLLERAERRAPEEAKRLGADDRAP